MVDAPFEAAIQVLVDVCKVLTVIVSNVRIGLSGVVADGVEMVVAPVFVSEESPCMRLDECGKAVTDIVILVRYMKLFSELDHYSSAGGDVRTSFYLCPDPVLRSCNVCAAAPERFHLSFNNLFAFDFVPISHTRPYVKHIDKDYVTEYYQIILNSVTVTQPPQREQR